eukprot:Ihof_evm1s241 gene=Ihof_evmTU1s241
MASTRLASEMEGDSSLEAKRSKQLTEGLMPMPGAATTEVTDLHACPPSKVVHIRGLPDYAQSSDLTTAIAPFGTISYVVMMKNNKQALVEMKDIGQALNLVRASSMTPLYVGQQRIFVNFSKSQEIARDMGPSGANGQDMKPSNILLLTVLNPLYPITTEVIFTIASPFGKVLRIVIFRKHGVQGMVEFETVESALRAREALNNADVYAGCCTLKIEFSKVTKLNVRRNDDDTFDYTQPNLAMARNSYPAPSRNQPMGVMGSMNGPMGNPMGQYGQMAQSGMGGPQGQSGMGMGGMGQSGMGMMGAGPVLMVYNLDAKMNCDRLFNLFCMYGNVAKVKFLPEKPGMAMVQMSDGYAADVAMQSLNDAPMFGTKIELRHSKHPYIAGNQQIKTLPDGTPATVEYGTSKLNRFLRPDNKNRLYKPSGQLHFFNAPPGSTPESITQICVDAGITPPMAVKIFDK